MILNSGYGRPVKKRDHGWSKVFILLILPLLFAFQGCGQLGTPQKYQNNDWTKVKGGGTTSGNPLTDGAIDLFLDPQLEDGKSNDDENVKIYMCIDRIEFEDNKVETGPTDVDIEVGHREIVDEPIYIGQVQPNDGIYQEIDLKVRPECGMGYSIRVVNDDGDFRSQEYMKLTFHGEFQFAQRDTTITLIIKNLIDDLRRVKSDQDLYNTIEEFEGRFQDYSHDHHH